MSLAGIVRNAGLEGADPRKLFEKRRDRKGYEHCGLPRVANSESKQVSTITVKPKHSRPVHDEWGFYDPEQAGLEAVIRRLTASRDEKADSTGTALAPHLAHRRSVDVSR
jgi:hypothetical protein